MELHALAAVQPKGHVLRSFAIIGSGPLPLTSLCIRQQLQENTDDVVCHNIDQDPFAVSMSMAMCRALGYDKAKICFQCAEANDENLDLSSFDVVYLAALVGKCDKSKHEVIANIVKRMRLGALVVLRSAHSLRSLLYPVRS